MKIIFMADGYVGLEITRWLLKEYRDDVTFVVTVSENEIFSLARQFQVPSIVFKSSNATCQAIKDLDIELDMGFLVWWPKIINKPLISLTQQGFINTHPSLLPYNRGKHYNFWALVEQAPFGVSLHFVDEGIDTGDIVAQETISYSWEDNGATLYSKAVNEMIRLFKKAYPEIRRLNIERQKQALELGSFHLASEIESTSFINLERTYKARDLLNLLRARTFHGHPSCWFGDKNGEEYEVRVEIKRKKP